MDGLAIHQDLKIKNAAFRRRCTISIYRRDVNQTAALQAFDRRQRLQP